MATTKTASEAASKASTEAARLTGGYARTTGPGVGQECAVEVTGKHCRRKADPRA